MTSVGLISGISYFIRNFRGDHTSAILRRPRLKFDRLSSVRHVIFRFMYDADNNSGLLKLTIDQEIRYQILTYFFKVIVHTHFIQIK